MYSSIKHVTIVYCMCTIVNVKVSVVQGAVRERKGDDVW